MIIVDGIGNGYKADIVVLTFTGPESNYIMQMRFKYLAYCNQDFVIAWFSKQE